MISRNEIKTRKTLNQRNKSMNRKRITDTIINFIEEFTNKTNGTIFSEETNKIISDTFNFPLSASTVRRYRYQMSFRYLKVKYAPILTQEHELMRLQWCLRNINNPFLELFYIFADETKIEINYKKEKHLRIWI